MLEESRKYENLVLCSASRGVGRIGSTGGAMNLLAAIAAGPRASRHPVTVPRDLSRYGHRPERTDLEVQRS